MKSMTPSLFVSQTRNTCFPSFVASTEGRALLIIWLNSSIFIVPFGWSFMKPLNASLTLTSSSPLVLVKLARSSSLRTGFPFLLALPLLLCQLSLMPRLIPTPSTMVSTTLVLTPLGVGLPLLHHQEMERAVLDQ